MLVDSHRVHRSNHQYILLILLTFCADLFYLSYQASSVNYGFLDFCRLVTICHAGQQRRTQFERVVGEDVDVYFLLLLFIIIIT